MLWLLARRNLAMAHGGARAPSAPPDARERDGRPPGEERTPLEQGDAAPS